MTSILGIGTSALGAFRRSLSTIGQNIANVNTEGYSRQRVVLGARPPQFSGGQFFGTGVEVSAVERYYNEYLDTQSRDASSSQARFSTLASFSSRIDNLLADPTGGLTPALSSFYSALQDFSADPSSTASRAGLLAETGNLVARFQSLDEQLAGISSESTNAVAETVTEINQLAESIADLNTQIVSSGRSTQPNDLLDQRDTLIRDLAQRIDVSTVQEESGSISLFIGNGQTLVIGDQNYPLAVSRNEFDPTRNDVVYQGLAGDTPIGDVLTGGALGALLEFQEGVLDPTRRGLGASAYALAEAINTQNAAGLDPDNASGGAIFGLGPARGISSALNTGSAGITVAVDNIGDVQNTNYNLLNDGTGFRLFRGDNGQEVTLAGSGSVADPFTADGLSIVVSGTAAAGDRFGIEPTLGVISELSLVATSGRAFAAAGPLRGVTDSTNLSDARIDSGITTDATDPNFFATSVIEFTTATTYSVNGAGSFAFTPGSPIGINGSDFTIDGAPTQGDRFTIEKNNNATGDNRNALALTQTQSQALLEGGTLSVGQSFSQLVASVGSATRQAESSAEAQTVLLQSAERRRLETSGVDLDEEAAQLIRFQQSYQAAAQVVAVASTLFDELINVTRR